MLHYFPLCTLLLNGLAGVLLMIQPIQGAIKSQEKTTLQTGAVQTLELEKIISGELTGDQKQVFQVTMGKQQVLTVFINQKGLRMIARVFDPDEMMIQEVRGVNTIIGTRQIYFISEKKGRYRIEIQGQMPAAKSGQFSISVKKLQNADQKDYQYRDIVEKFSKAERLHAQRTKDSIQAALILYQEILPLAVDYGDPSIAAQLHNYMGLGYETLGNLPKAIEAFQSSIAILAQIGEKSTQVTVLINLSRVYTTQGDNSRVIECSLKGLPLARESGNRQAQAQILGGLGMAYRVEGNYKQAIEYLAEAQQIADSIGDMNGKAVLLLNLGSTTSLAGDKQKALNLLNQGAQLAQSLKLFGTQARCFNSIGVIQYEFGEFQKALNSYQNALNLYKQILDNNGSATTLQNIATIFNTLGDRKRGVKIYLEVLEVVQKIGDRQLEVSTLFNLGNAFTQLNDLPKAKEYLTQALALSRQVQDRQVEIRALSQLAVLLGEEKNWEACFASFDQAFKIARSIENRRQQEIVLEDSGYFYLLKGDISKAEAALTQSLELAQALKFPQGQIQSLFHLARLERDRNNLQASLNKIEQAIKLIEVVRTNVGDQGLRSSYFDSVNAYFELYIDLLMRLHKTDPGAGYDARALQVCEQSRARSLLDLLVEARADIRQGVTPELLAQERTLTQKLTEQTSRFVQSLNERAPAEKIKELETSLASINAELETVKTSIRTSNPQYAGLTQLRTLTVPEIQSQVVDADTILVEYQLGEDRSYLWVVTPTQLLSYELPKRSEIEGSVRKVYDWLTAYQKKTNEPVEAYLKRAAQSDTQYWVEAGQLSQVLFGQVAAQLGTKRLLIVADGALHYLPFAALPVPTPDADSTTSGKKNSRKKPSKKTRKPAMPFIANQEVVTLPSASMLALLREETPEVTATKTVVAFADPVFSPTDPRVKSKAGPGASGSDPLQTDPQIGEASTLTRAFESFDETRISFEGQQIRRLPGSLKEADILAELTAQSEKQIATGFEATRTAVLENDLTQFRYIHFATHGLLNSGSPELSGLVLTLVNPDGTPQDGFLSLQDIYNLKLDSDCVVLSACQTALGKNMRGEGLVGLTRGFMYAGARRVVASLWSVNDASTVELMREFYGQILQKHQRPAAALRLAQQTLWKQKPNRNPYFWAGFILQGEYR